MVPAAAIEPGVEDVPAGVEEGERQAAPSPPVTEKVETLHPTRVTQGNARGNSAAPKNAIAPEWIYEPPARFIPFLDTPGHGPEWAAVFLVDYATHGGQPLAASRAGVTMKTVEQEADRDPVFAEEMERALEYHRSLLEWESLNLGRCKHSPLPFFDRLKAELPARHVDRAVIASMTVTAELTGVEAARALRDMLTAMTPSTQAMLTIPQLPEGNLAS